eukprot:4406722-Prymnesium_polylepis.1
MRAALRAKHTRVAGPLRMRAGALAARQRAVSSARHDPWCPFTPREPSEPDGRQRTLRRDPPRGILAVALSRHAATCRTSPALRHSRAPPRALSRRRTNDAERFAPGRLCCRGGQGGRRHSPCGERGTGRWGAAAAAGGGGARAVGAWGPATAGPCGWRRR